MAQVLLGMELDEIRELVGERHPAYRARQIYHALYRQNVGELTEVSTLPWALRRELARSCSTGSLRLDRRFESRDGTRRYLLRLEDQRTVETVLMPEDGHCTLCISTQIGCPVRCKFCLTGLMGLERSLTAGEIVGQVLFVAREQQLPTEKGNLNIVLMGMGEPLLNLPNVIKATRLLVDPSGMGISPRRITLSTSGITPKIEELGREPVRPKLAISLNASTEEQRRLLMPIACKYPLKKLLKTCRSYPLRPWERLTFEYVLLAGVNDSDSDARRVVKLLANLKCKVNLIPFNPGPGIEFKAPCSEQIHTFQAILRSSMPCFIRKSRGRDIFAACGQLKRALTTEDG